MALPMFAAKVKHAVVFEDPQAYDCIFINVATSGTKNIKVSGVDKKKDAAIARAQMNAIHAIIFKGIPGGDTGQPTPALYGSSSPSSDHEQYFDDFFNNGDYTGFVTQTTSPSGKDMSEVKGGIKVKVEVQVKFDDLRNKLTQDGIIKGIADALEGQQQPTVMIFPNKNWCLRHNYTMDGDPKTVDYDKALADTDMMDLINAFEKFMQGVGYEPKKLSKALSDYRDEKAHDKADEVDDGEGAAGGMREMLASTASADFIIEFYPETQQANGKQFVIFRIEATDASTGKGFYSNSGQGTPVFGNAQMVNQLNEAILSIKDEFLGRLQNKFDNMAKQGREVRILIKRKPSCPITFAKKYDGAALSEYIEAWIEELVQTPGFISGQNTKDKLTYEQIYIPLKTEKRHPLTKKMVVKAQSAQDFAEKIADHITELTEQPCRVEKRSMGYAVITMGVDDSGEDE